MSAAVQWDKGMFGNKGEVKGMQMHFMLGMQCVASEGN